MSLDDGDGHRYRSAGTVPLPAVPPTAYTAPGAHHGARESASASASPSATCTASPAPARRASAASTFPGAASRASHRTVAGSSRPIPAAGHANRSARYSRPGVEPAGTDRAHSNRTSTALGSGPVSAGSGAEFARDAPPAPPGADFGGRDVRSCARDRENGLDALSGRLTVSHGSGNASRSTAPKPSPPPSMQPRHPTSASAPRRRICSRSGPPHDGHGPVSSPERFTRSSRPAASHQSAHVGRGAGHRRHRASAPVVSRSPAVLASLPAQARCALAPGPDRRRRGRNAVHIGTARIRGRAGRAVKHIPLPSIPRSAAGASLKRHLHHARRRHRVEPFPGPRPGPH